MNLKVITKIFRSTLVPMISALLVIPSAVLIGSTNQIPSSQIEIYLLIGQSNMAGRGVIDAESLETDARVLCFNKKNSWELAKDPLHFDKPTAVGVGPGLTFGKAMAKNFTGKVIGLVPCAFGGTSIKKWDTDSRLYQVAVHRTRLAMRNGNLKGILWHQGESDIAQSENLKNYAENLSKLITQLRKDLESPEAPFVCSELADFDVKKSALVKQFNDILHELKMSVSNFAVINADELHHMDGIHLDTASARELGRRYSVAMLQLNKSKLMNNGHCNQ